MMTDLFDGMNGLLGGRRSQRGLTLVEVVVAIGISGFILVAMGLLISRVFRLPPSQVEQGRIIADAQVEMERMSDTIRNARDESGQRWLQMAEPCSIELFSNTDNDATSELVRYWLDGSNLMRSVDGGGGELLARSFRNNCADRTSQLFTYYSLGGGNAIEVDPAVVSLDSIDRVSIRFVVDVDLNQMPAAAEIETVVTPRRESS